MKIAYINGGLSLSETFIYDLLKGLSKSFEVTFFTAQTPYYTDGFNFKQVDYLLSSRLSSYIKRLLPNSGKKIVWRLSQDRVNKKLASAIRNYDFIYIDYGTSAVSSLSLLKQVKKPFIVHFHGFDITSSLTDPFYRKYLQEVFDLSKYVIAASEHIKRLLILEGCNEEKIRVIRYGIKKELVKGDIKEKSTDKCLVFVGRLTPKKHPIALIRAFNLVLQQVPDAILNIVGNGPLLKRCKQLSEDLGIDKQVKFHEEMGNEDALAILKKSAIYVQHSVTATSGDQEGFGMSMAEAALYSKPVVSTLHNGIPENVIHNETGFLVPEFNFELMATRIIELLNDPDKAKEMGQRGRDHILKLCDSRRRVEQITALITQ